MGKVQTHMTMSLDGFIARTGDDPAELFEWYDAGEVEVATDQPGLSFHVDAASAELLQGLLDRTGAMIAGRRLFDLTDGWGDRHPVGAPVVVVTHRPPPEDAATRFPRTTFVGGVEEAVVVAKELAGDLDVTIASPDVIRQALELGLVDDVCISLVPALFGEGIPYFAALAGGHLLLDDPEVVPGKRALHLRYPVRR